MTIKLRGSKRRVVVRPARRVLATSKRAQRNAGDMANNTAVRRVIDQREAEHAEVNVDVQHHRLEHRATVANRRQAANEQRQARPSEQGAGCASQQRQQQALGEELPTMRAGLAPRARRTPISWARTVERASNRPATLAQAISSSSATPAINTSRPRENWARSVDTPVATDSRLKVRTPDVAIRSRPLF